MSKLKAVTFLCLTVGADYLGNDRCAVLLCPDGGRTLVGSGAASLAPATVGHPGRQQAGSTGGQLTAAGADQGHLGDLDGGGRVESLFFLKLNERVIKCISSSCSGFPLTQRG